MGYKHTDGVTTDNIQTIMHSNEYVIKSVNIESKVYNTINKLTDEYNSKLSNGVLIYELFQMYNENCTDILTQREQTINNKLQKYITESDIQTIDEYTDSIDADRVMVNMTPDKYKPHEKLESIKIRIPPIVEQQVQFKRGWNKRIKEYLNKYIRSPYNCRHDRIQVKEQLHNYYSKNSNINGKTQEIQSEISETTDISTIDEYKEYGDTVSNWRDRKQIIVDLIKENNLNKNNVDTLIKSAHKINTDSYRKRIIDEIWDEYKIDYIIYNTKETITQRFDTINKQLILNKNNVIKSRHDAIKVAEEIDDIQFIENYVEPKTDIVIDLKEIR